MKKIKVTLNRDVDMSRIIRSLLQMDLGLEVSTSQKNYSGYPYYCRKGQTVWGVIIHAVSVKEGCYTMEYDVTSAPLCPDDLKELIKISPGFIFYFDCPQLQDVSIIDDLAVDLFKRLHPSTVLYSIDKRKRYFLCQLGSQTIPVNYKIESIGSRTYKFSIL